MPMIVAKVDTLKNMQGNLRVTLLKAGIPEYSWTQQREGFEVWHAEENEGETMIIWHTFTDDGDVSKVEERKGLEQCAAVLQEHYWVHLYVPNSLALRYGRMSLRVLFGLTWLK